MISQHRLLTLHFRQCEHSTKIASYQRDQKVEEVTLGALVSEKDWFMEDCTLLAERNLGLHLANGFWRHGEVNNRKAHRAWYIKQNSSIF